MVSDKFPEAEIARPATRFNTVFTMIGLSSAVFAAYVVPHARTEWVDVMLDYCHHKRTSFVPNIPDTLVRSALRLVRFVR